MKRTTAICTIFFCLISVVTVKTNALAQANHQDIKIINADSGWANNSINAVVFRKNSLVTFRNTQYISFYDKNSYVVLGKRKSGSTHWQFKRTIFKGNTADAHNTISIMTDGDGYLHIAWDHHNNELRYCKSILPGSLELTQKLPMTGKQENRVSYPEFYKMSNGDLLFFYRDGGSGQGNFVVNKYDLKTKQWSQLYSNLIDGQGQRSAYTQACIDAKGTIHISWVWRETPDVASNHDMCYARSRDGGKTWEKSTGEKYTLPITAATAEYALKIAQKSELINQTSMFADAAGRPYIATYWRDSGTTVPQYHLIYKNNDKWQLLNTNFRKTPFSLSGMGSMKIPVSRPQIVAWQQGKALCTGIIYRDEERGNKASIATCLNLSKNNWHITDLTTVKLNAWEPTYDTELWKEKGILNLFIEKVEQVSAEGLAHVAPQMIQILEWKPQNKK